MGVKSMDPVGTTALEPFARNHQRSEDLDAAQKSRAPRARPRPPSSHCGSSSNRLWTIVSSSAIAPLRRGSHRLSWRKERRTRMEIASSTQRRKCLLREECEDALLLKEQCAVDEQTRGHHVQLGTKWDSSQRLWLPVERTESECECGAQPRAKGDHCAFARPRAMLWTESVREVRRHLLPVRRQCSTCSEPLEMAHVCVSQP